MGKTGLLRLGKTGESVRPDTLLRIPAGEPGARGQGPGPGPRPRLRIIIPVLRVSERTRRIHELMASRIWWPFARWTFS